MIGNLKNYEIKYLNMNVFIISCKKEKVKEYDFVEFCDEKLVKIYCKQLTIPKYGIII